MSKWSPEPWKYYRRNPLTHRPDRWIQSAAGVVVDRVLEDADGERIVACVNALAGLEPGLVKELIAINERLVSWSDHAFSEEYLMTVIEEARTILAKIKKEKK